MWVSLLDTSRPQFGHDVGLTRGDFPISLPILLALLKGLNMQFFCLLHRIALLMPISLVAACSGNVTSTKQTTSLNSNLVSTYSSPALTAKNRVILNRRVRSSKTRSLNVGLLKTPQKRPRTKKAYLGRASYICSPSGFGRKSSCFKRNG